MRVCVYRGGLRLVEKSGVGQAIHHEICQLKLAGVQLTAPEDPKAQILLFNTVFPDAVLLALRKKREGKKIIWYGHSTEDDFRNSFRFSNQLSPAFGRWIRHCYNMADAVITPTEYARGKLLELGVTSPVYVLSNGVDPKRFHEDPQKALRFRNRYHIGEDEKVVLSVGHYMERKGILDFLDLARRMPDVRFFWFGHTGRALETTRVERAIEQAPANVTFPGFCSQEELVDAYCGSDLFLFMSHEETEGIVVLEALSCGIPVLVRDIPVYQGWLMNGVNVYKASTQEEFLKKTERILGGTLPDLTAMGIRTARERSLKKVGQRLLRIQQEVLGKDHLMLVQAE